MSRIGRLLGGRHGKPGEGRPGDAKPGNGKTFGPAPLLSSLGMSSSLFADASNFDQRFIEDYDKIETTVNALRTLGFKVVLTSGSFDVIHEGHSMYLEAARQFGDFLIVGLDSDEKIRGRKGENRPVGARRWSGSAWSPTSAAWAWSRSSTPITPSGR